MTDYLPPPAFDGCQQGKWGDHRYSRRCTVEEIALIERLNEADLAKGLAAAAAARDVCLADMAAEIAEFDSLPITPSSA